MTYRIELSHEAQAELIKLDNSAAKRIIEKLQQSASNPIHFFERLVGREDYRVRIGDYRAIATIDRKNKVVFVISVGHRKNVYK